MNNYLLKNRSFISLPVHVDPIATQDNLITKENLTNLNGRMFWYPTIYYHQQCYYCSTTTYHLSSITYHLSPITYHLSPITYQIYLLLGNLQTCCPSPPSITLLNAPVLCFPFTVVICLPTNDICVLLIAFFFSWVLTTANF